MSPTMPGSTLVTVCDRCLRATCFQGIFMCEDARIAGTTRYTFKELSEMGLEHSDYWRSRP